MKNYDNLYWLYIKSNKCQNKTGIKSQPSSKQKNIFDATHNTFSAKHLDKSSPANSIPIYKRDDLSEYLLENQLMPIRCGQGEFFFYRGEIVFDLREVEHEAVSYNIKGLD